MSSDAGGVVVSSAAGGVVPSEVGGVAPLQAARSSVKQRRSRARRKSDVRFIKDDSFLFVQKTYSYSFGAKVRQSTFVYIIAQDEKNVKKRNSTSYGL